MRAIGQPDAAARRAQARDGWEGLTVTCASMSVWLSCSTVPSTGKVTSCTCAGECPSMPATLYLTIPTVVPLNERSCRSQVRTDACPTKCASTKMWGPGARSLIAGSVPLFAVSAFSREPNGPSQKRAGVLSCGTACSERRFLQLRCRVENHSSCSRAFDAAELLRPVVPLARL